MKKKVRTDINDTVTNKKGCFILVITGPFPQGFIYSCSTYLPASMSADITIGTRFRACVRPDIGKLKLVLNSG